ncbi:hypothetical protein [Endozoicomonas sp. ALB032]|uniref:hypothetical protein n=1 Tax=Endozoicomonas sp. ALB032 TaxID=3403082 RepID=UPI003BB4E66E
MTNKSGFSDQFAAAAVGQSILGQAPSKIDLNVTVETAPGKKEKLLQVKKRLHKAA